jgi:hypothetical protein
MSTHDMNDNHAHIVNELTANLEHYINSPFILMTCTPRR